MYKSQFYSLKNSNSFIMKYSKPSEFNEIYEIRNVDTPYDKYNIGILYGYNHHLNDIISLIGRYLTRFDKRLNDWKNEDFYIGVPTELGGDDEENEFERMLFHEFLIRYMSGEFKCRKSYRHNYKYYHELPYQAQSNIKRVADTLNDLIAA